jgi:TRAP-type mannitol/chloroaromatic compound transport system substrate-binding protein
MKKSLTIMVAVVLATVFCAGLAMAQSGVIKWKMVSTWTPSIDLLEGDKNFAKLVNEMSAGRLQITVSPAGELVPANAVFDTVAKGSVECGGDWPSYWAGKNSAFDLLGSFPMGLTQYDYINWYYHYGGKKVFDDLFGKYNMVYFLTSVSPQESGIRTRMPIKSLADYKGKKLRMSGKADGDNRRRRVQRPLDRLEDGICRGHEVQYRSRMASALLHVRRHDQQGRLGKTSGGSEIGRRAGGPGQYGCHEQLV